MTSGLLLCKEALHHIIMFDRLYQLLDTLRLDLYWLANRLQVIKDSSRTVVSVNLYTIKPPTGQLSCTSRSSHVCFPITFHSKKLPSNGGKQRNKRLLLHSRRRQGSIIRIKGQHAA